MGAEESKGRGGPGDFEGQSGIVTVSTNGEGVSGGGDPAAWGSLASPGGASLRQDQHPPAGDDELVARLSRVPVFFPLLKSSLEGSAAFVEGGPDRFYGVNSFPVLHWCRTLQSQMRVAAEDVCERQAAFGPHIAQADKLAAQNAGILATRERAYADAASHFNEVRNIKRTLGRVGRAVGDAMRAMEKLNNV